MMGNKKKVRDIFVKSYSNAFKFYRFRKSKDILVLEGTYYLPQCVKNRLNCTLIDLSNGEEAIVNGNETVSGLYTSTRKKELKEKMISLESFGACIFSPEGRCDHCFEVYDFCHNKMYTNYIAHRMTQLVGLYPQVFDSYNTQKTYIKLYNSANHFVEFKKTRKVVASTLNVPPKCMKENMDEVITSVVYKHKYCVQDMTKDEVLEWKGADMNLNGVVPFDDYF